ncbi:hypothetical protein HBHAL_2542 [Halobacillus halophilus DSM 2266]|uniref:Uncharacterized protein n=1 Tax=Halobacillus halophilus (strain ATCC 35676 / DSM 2266 / JCM 20832 / KCTC 3685 / LMG 17431 / NBRC 102448 / NCIMB 2269) TaxID=866895 RepID=I0JL68_HALH3|nr:hypothetical protein [Halobacillus halophilus]CCG44888.1 hypothetical protein HBHAL_2542 [Halobacillus halophilus DSM 2266]
MWIVFLIIFVIAAIAALALPILLPSKRNKENPDKYHESRWM